MTFQSALHPVAARHSHGFTLIELLVVIAIVAILASILLPTIAYAKKVAKVKKAAIEMTNLQSAIQQYEAEYNRMPVSNPALTSATASCPDFTCGTVMYDGSTLSPIRIVNTGGGGYENANSEIVSILRSVQLYPNETNGYNPRRIVFLQGRETGGTSEPGVGSDGVFRDPWGQPYIVTVDMNGDGECQDGFYWDLTKAKGRLLVRGSVMVWSMGPDREAKLDRQLGPKGGVNKDNVLSWE